MSSSQTFDAVIILGGGLDESHQPHSFVKERIRVASLQSTTNYFILSSRGTTHKPPPFDAGGFPLDESVVSARHLRTLLPDLESSRILLDKWSLDTIGNAWFALINFVEPFELKKVLVVTSQFHMPRSEQIFRHIFGQLSLVQDLELTFEASEDVGMDPALLQLRQEKETASLQHWLKTAARCSTRSLMAKFLFLEHGAYNGESAMVNSACVEKKDAVSDAVKGSY